MLCFAADFLSLYFLYSKVLIAPEIVKENESLQNIFEVSDASFVLNTRKTREQLQPLTNYNKVSVFNLLLRFSFIFCTNDLALPLCNVRR